MINAAAQPSARYGFNPKVKPRKTASFCKPRDRSRNNCGSWTRKSSALAAFAPKSCDSGYDSRTLTGRTILNNFWHNEGCAILSFEEPVRLLGIVTHKLLRLWIDSQHWTNPKPSVLHG